MTDTTKDTNPTGEIRSNLDDIMSATAALSTIADAYRFHPDRDARDLDLAATLDQLAEGIENSVSGLLSEVDDLAADVLTLARLAMQAVAS